MANRKNQTEMEIELAENHLEALQHAIDCVADTARMIHRSWAIGRRAKESKHEAMRKCLRTMEVLNRKISVTRHEINRLRTSRARGRAEAAIKDGD